jgi:hypothetical protein
LPKRWIPLPSLKTAMIFTVVVVYTIVLTSLTISIIDGNAPIRMPTIGNIITTAYEAHGGDINTTGGNQTIDWGTIYVGGSTNRSFILKNKSNTITTPQLNATNWIFKDQQGQQVAPPTVNNMIVNWTLNNTPLNPNEEVNVTITLTIRFDTTFVNYIVDNNIKTFSFDIIIQPSQA